MERKFFGALRMGGAFVKFMIKDLEGQCKKYGSRAMRRRIEKELVKGVLSEELASLYLNKVEMVNEYLENQLNPKSFVAMETIPAGTKVEVRNGMVYPVQVTEQVDGVDYFYMIICV